MSLITPVEIFTQKINPPHREIISFFNAMDEVFFSLDITERRLTEVSNACQEILGYSATALLANNQLWFMLPHTDDKHIITTDHKKLQSGCRVCSRYRIVHSNGSIRWVEEKTLPTLNADGNLIRVDGLIRDITASYREEEKHRKSAEALKKSEANLRAVFDNTDSSYILANSDLRIVSFNALAQKYSLARNGGKELKVDADIQDYFPAERWPFILEVLAKVAGGEHIKYEINFTKPDGSQKWHEVRWLNVRNTEDKNWGFILANTDITEAKLIALEREKITADLIQHNSHLEQFTYIVSHNLRAPVANIIGLSGLLKEPELDDEIKEEAIDKVSSSIKSIDTVIQDLNNILQSRKPVNEKKELVEFAELVEAIEATVSDTMINENVRISYDFEETGSIFTIRSYLYSIFYNLISNSIKYRQPDTDPIIDIRSYNHEGKTELRFKDNGKGIDLERNGRNMFGLYKRFDTTVEGKGMGLFMVKTQVEALGGSINIESQLGEGTEFIIRFS